MSESCTFNSTPLQGATQTISSVLTGNSPLTVTGTGILTLTANNSYTGVTRILSGTLQLGNGGSTGSAGSGNIVISPGATLMVNSSNNVNNFAGTVSGGGSLVKTGSGQVTFSSAASYTGGTIIAGGTLQITAANNIPPGTLVNNATLNIDATLSDYTYSGTISGTGTINKTGAHKISFTGTMNPTGPFNIQQGTWEVLGASSFNNTAPNISGGSTLRLAPTGTMSSTISGTGSGTLEIGSGTVNITSSTLAYGLTVKSGATCVMQGGQGGASNYGVSVFYNNGGITVEPSATLTVNADWALGGTETSYLLGNNGQIQGNLILNGHQAMGSCIFVGATLSGTGALILTNGSWQTVGGTTSISCNVGNPYNGVAAINAPCIISGNLYSTSPGDGTRFRKTGTGTLTLSGNNSGLNGIDLLQGTIVSTNSTSFGNLLSASGDTGIELQNSTTYSTTIQASGGTIFDINVSGSYATAVTWAGEIDTASSPRINKSGPGSFTIAGRNQIISASVTGGFFYFNSSNPASNPRGDVALSIPSGATGTFVFFTTSSPLPVGSISMGGGTLQQYNDNGAITPGSFTTVAGGEARVQVRLGGSYGITVVAGAFLTLQPAVSPFTNSFTGGVTVNNGGTLRITNGGDLGTGALTLQSGSTVTSVGNLSMLVWNPVSIVYSSPGNYNFGDASNTGTMELQAPINLGASGNTPSFNVASGCTLTLSGTLSDSGAGLINGSSGTLVISRNNSYTGGTTINAGTIQAGNVNAFGTGTITVNAGGTLNKNGYAIANTIVNNGGTVNP